MVVLYPHTLVSWRHIPRTKRAAHGVARGVRRGDGALAIVSANRLPEISPFPRNARRRGRRRYGKSPNAIVNRKFPTTNYPPPSTSLHFYTAKAISHDGEGAVATYGRSQQVRPSRVDLRSQWTATLPWRWRPRHRICQPPSRNQSIPAQRTTTGAPSLRHYPLPNYQLNRKIVNSQLPTTHYQLPTIIYISTLLHGHSLNH